MKLITSSIFDRPVLLLGIASMAFLLLRCGTPLNEKPTRPNIIVILADDLGYGDLGCYNPKSLVPTPNLDQFASEGIRLTNAYCPVSVCSPTRYALMTGRYPFRSWKKSGVMSNYEPSMIDSGILTLPQMMQAAGYNTAGFGKWHLGTNFPTLDGNKPVGYGKFRDDNNGENIDVTGSVSDGPVDHGFDHWIGFSCASECWLLNGNSIFGAIKHDLYTIDAAPNKDNIELVPLEDYLPFITGKALSFLNDKAALATDQPFFLYFAPYVPHLPLTVSPEFRGLTNAGIYGDYVHELDYYLGKLFNAVDSLGLKENTIVLFASDNGSTFNLTSSEIDLSTATNGVVHYEAKNDTMPVHYPNWPLRGTKHTIYEGGVRTPFIARWPTHFPAGTASTQLIGLNDLMATLAAVIDFKSVSETALDSHNFLPALKGQEGSSRESIVVQGGKVYGIIQGKWKFIGGGDYSPKNPGDPAGELYDLSADESESVNLYVQHPDIVAGLKSKLESILGNELPVIAPK